MIGNRIKLLREEKKLKQEDLAKIIDVSPSAIGMYERDAREPNDNITLKLAEYFGVTTDYLLGKSDVRNFDKNIQGVEKNSGVPAVVFIYGTIPAGVPIEMIEDIIDTEEVPIEMTKGDKQLFRASYKR